MFRKYRIYTNHQLDEALMDMSKGKSLTNSALDHSINKNYLKKLNYQRKLG